MHIYIQQAGLLQWYMSTSLDRHKPSSIDPGLLYTCAPISALATYLCVMIDFTIQLLVYKAFDGLQLRYIIDKVVHNEKYRPVRL